MRHLMSPLDFSVEELDTLLDLAQDIEAHPDKYAHACDGKKLATLFYEPSTRTRLSHEAAMLNLGGSIMGFSSADSSSAAKGESVSDTIRTISCYADICAMRHPKEGAPMVACQHSSSEQFNDRSVRRPEIRSYRPLADPRTCTLHRDPFCTDLPGRAASPGLYPSGCARQTGNPLP